MKITLITETKPQGFEVEWPCAPGTGDWVGFRYPGGLEGHQVATVEYVADRDHALVEVRVTLERT